MENKKGLVHVYTGNGKGKTTASLGLALRAVSHNFKVIIFRFMKGDIKEKNEKDFLKKNHIEVININTLGFYEIDKKSEQYNNFIAEIKTGWEKVKESIINSKFQVIILDEINVCLKNKIIPVADFIETLKNKKQNIEVICTGRYAPNDLIEYADYVTEMKLIKHPYTKGIQARIGIEY